MSSDISRQILYVKNLPQPSEKLVSVIFGLHGGSFQKMITSTDPTKTYVLVKFESEEAATKARDVTHGKVVDGCKLFVDYAVSNESIQSSPSQKQKLSVLDRIIKPGSTKAPNAENKFPVSDGQANIKEVVIHDDKEDGCPPEVVKPVGQKLEVQNQQNFAEPEVIVIDGHESSGSYNAKLNSFDNVQFQKKFTPHRHDRMNYRGHNKMPQKLEIIKPKQTLSSQNSGAVSLAKSNSDLNENSEVIEIKAIDVVSRTGSRSVNYNPTKNKNASRSRSGSKSVSRSRHPGSRSRGKPDSYYHSNSRRSRSRSSSQSRKKRSSRSRSYDRNNSPNGGRSYSSRKGNGLYKDSGFYHNRRSRSRSGSDSADKRYGSKGGYRGYNRDRYREHSRSWSKSRSRSRSRDNYCGSYNGSRNRSDSQSSYDRSNSRGKRNGNYKPIRIVRRGLVIEKAGPKRYDNSGTKERSKQRNYQYSRSRSRDRRYSRNGDDRNRKGSDNPEAARRKSYSRSPEKDKNKKVLDIRKDDNFEKNRWNRDQNNLKQRIVGHDNRVFSQENVNKTNYHPRHNSQFEFMAHHGPHPYSHYYNLNNNNLQNIFTNNLLTYSNTHQQEPTSNASLPSYLYPPGANPELNTKTHSVYQFSTYPIQNQATVIPNPSLFSSDPMEIQNQNGLTNNEKETIAQRDLLPVSNIETSTTENSNNDGKIDEKIEPSEKKEGTASGCEDGSSQGKLNNPITYDFIKKNKMLPFINYIIATGDIKGLKEKLKALEQLK